MCRIVSMVMDAKLNSSFGIDSELLMHFSRVDFRKLNSGLDAFQ